MESFKKIYVPTIVLLSVFFISKSLEGSTSSIHDTFNYYATLNGQARACNIKFAHIQEDIDVWLNVLYNNIGANKSEWNAAYTVTSLKAYHAMKQTPQDCWQVQSQISSMEKNKKEKLDKNLAEIKNNNKKNSVDGKGVSNIPVKKPNTSPSIF